MSRNQRIGLIVVALVVAVVAFVIASPGGDDDSGDQAAQTTPATETQPGTATDAGGGAEAEPTETQAAEAPPKPEVTRIRLQGGQVAGGPPTITAKNGDTVRIVVSSDAPDDIHLHGYDIEKPVEPGKPAVFKVKTNIEGSFEMESHIAEDAGREPLVARLNVEPR